jgi:magnesium chelatase family protein
MVARVRTVAFHGVEVIEVETQVTIASGLPAFTVVGLPDKAVAESRERVRAALASLGLGLPPRRITVNLAPADVVKEGSHFDLPIALACWRRWKRCRRTTSPATRRSARWRSTGR